MGAIIEKYAFPNDLYRYNYEETIGEQLHKIQLCNKQTIYAATYQPSKKSKTTVIYSHANGEDIGFVHYLVEAHCEALSINIVTYDWEGYGMSTGKPSEQAMRRGVQAAFELAIQIFPGTRYISWGRSIGTTPACFLAHLHPQQINHLILQSPIASAFHAAFKNPCCDIADMFKNYNIMKYIKCGVTIIHGLDDTVVPYRNALKIFDSYCNANRKVVMESVINDQQNNYFDNTNKQRFYKANFYSIQHAGHNNLDSAYKKILRKIILEILLEESETLILISSVKSNQIK